MNNTAEVTAGKPKVGGALNVAAEGTTLPTDATTALAAGFANLGYVSEDGITQTITRTSDKIKAWGGDIVMTTQTEYGVDFKFKLIQPLNVDVRKTVYGDDNVTGDLTNGIVTKMNSKELPAKSWVIDMIWNSALDRIVIPRGKVSEVGDVVYVDSDTIGYDMTITALPDTNGNCSYEYTKTSGTSY